MKRWYYTAALHITIRQNTEWDTRTWDQQSPQTLFFFNLPFHLTRVTFFPFVINRTTYGGLHAAYYKRSSNNLSFVAKYELLHLTVHETKAVKFFKQYTWIQTATINRQGGIKPFNAQQPLLSHCLNELRRSTQSVRSRPSRPSRPLPFRLYQWYQLSRFQVEFTLRLTVSQSVFLSIEQPCGTYDQILLPFAMLLSEICGLPLLRAFIVFFFFLF
jgi:hypothetical protein